MCVAQRCKYAETRTNIWHLQYREDKTIGGGKRSLENEALAFRGCHKIHLHPEITVNSAGLSFDPKGARSSPSMPRPSCVSPKASGRNEKCLGAGGRNQSDRTSGTRASASSGPLPQAARWCDVRLVSILKARRSSRVTRWISFILPFMV